MTKTEFGIVFCSFGNLPTVQATLPTIIRECKQSGAGLVVHDCTAEGRSAEGRAAQWAWLQQQADEHGFFLMLSSPMSMAQARNLSLQLCIDQFLPSYICLMEVDHGVRPGFVKAMLDAQKKYYGQEAPNGLRYGLFTGCAEHHNAKLHALPDGNAYPDWDTPPLRLGGVNSCMRCAPTQHWLAVLKGYDVDEYPISRFQTGPSLMRNYHRGFTVMVVGQGQYVFEVQRAGRGVTASKETAPLWDDFYTRSDRRAHVSHERPEHDCGGLIWVKQLPVTTGTQTQ
jgi:hypothetical protein